MPHLSIEQYQAHFGEAPGYCDFARFGPISYDVAKARSELAEVLTSGAIDWDRLEMSERALRQIVAELTGRSSADQVVLAANTSSGLFQVAFGLPTGKGGELLVSPKEFPANVYPWLRASERGGPTVRFLQDPEGCVRPERVADALRSQTVALAVSAVDFRTGYSADLAGLREVLGERLLLVDAIQGFGACDLDWSLADAVVAGGQKWLRAGWGTGFISFSPRALELLGGGLTGWFGMQQPTVYSALGSAPQTTAARFTMTAPDPVAAAGLQAALHLVRDVSPAAIDKAISERTRLLIEHVQGADGLPVLPLGPNERSGIVSFLLPGRSPDDVATALAKEGIVTTKRENYVRISPHATTPLFTIEAFGAVINQLGRRRPRVHPDP